LGLEFNMGIPLELFKLPISAGNGCLRVIHCEKIVVFKAGVSPDPLQHGMIEHDT